MVLFPKKKAKPAPKTPKVPKTYMERHNLTMTPAVAEQIKKNRVENARMIGNTYGFKKGVSGNPAGRPKGPSMKEWSRSYLESLTEDERIEFMKGIPNLDVWKMAEGNAHTTQDIKAEITLPKPILGGTSIKDAVQSNNGGEADTEAQEALEDHSGRLLSGENDSDVIDIY